MANSLVARLERWKSRYGAPHSAALHQLLAKAGKQRLTDAVSLIRLHECLLFLRAYPPDAKTMRLAETALRTFPNRAAQANDPEPFEDGTVSGIAGTSFSAVFSYEVAVELCARYPRDIEIDWENYDQSEKLGPVLRRFVPLVGEDWPVEAHVPFRAWVDAARAPRESALAFLLRSIAALPLNARDQADLYGSLELLLLWHVGARPSRSQARWPVRKPYFHREPLLQRGDISLAAELEAAPLPVERLTKAEAGKVLDLILDTSAVRYRELYGFSHPDRNRVFRANCGRGVEVVYFGVPAEWRLPLRAYHAGMFFKNGVPAGYVEVLSLFDRAEVGFNLYYTFREGESAWLYARLLRLFRQILGVRCFSVDPYQIGLENDEALDSGAFWFYRKLGFRPVDPLVAQLVAREEERMRRKPGYRSSRPTLAKLAHSYLIYECADAEHGAWDRFTMRELGLRCARGGTPESILKMDALVRAKSGPDETRYLRLMQQQTELRAAMMALGQSEPGA